MERLWITLWERARRGATLVLLLLLVAAPGAALAQGTSITYGSSAIGSLTAEAPFIIYTFNGNAGDQVVAYAIGITPQMTPSLSLLGVDQRQLVVNDRDPFGSVAGGAARIAYRLPQTGRYSLMVSNTAAVPGEFLLRLDGQPAAASNALQPGTPIAASVLPDAPPAVYSFSADPNGPLTLTLSTQTPSFGFLAQVFDGRGQQIAGLAGEALRAASLTVGPGSGQYQVWLLPLSPQMQGEVALLLGAEEPGQVTLPQTPAPTQPAGAQTCVVTPSGNLNVNVRGGPGTNYPTIGALNVGAFMDVIGQDAFGQWFVVSLDGRRGWVAASVTTLQGPCQNLTIFEAPPTPVPTVTPLPTVPPGPQISFTVNGASSATIAAGQCATVRWDVDNVQAVYYQNQGVSGHDQRQECPTSTTTYTLRVVLNDGSTVERQVTINVVGSVPALNPFGSPNYGAVSLASGFLPDPYSVGVTSGGSVGVYYLGGPCRGYATSSPDYRLQWSGGGPRLRFYFIGGGDTTLVVRNPGGSWYCNDDGAGYPNPLIEFSPPADGQYDVWVASYSAGQFISGTLYITEQELP